MKLANHLINVGYRTADNKSWLANPSVIGFEVRKSANHTPNEFCDNMVGIYPKEFLFTGWHDKCICFAIPILASKEDRSSIIDAILRGDDPSTLKIFYIKDIPAKASQYIEDNADKIAALEEKPTWVIDNFREGNLLKGLVFKTSSETFVEERCKKWYQRILRHH